MSILPAHYPIASECAHSLEGLRNNSIEYNELTDLENEIMDSSIEFIDSLINSDEDMDLTPIRETLESFQRLKQNQTETANFDRVFQRAKGEIRQLSREEPELTIRNLKQYQEYYHGATFSRLIQQYTTEHGPLQANYENNENYTFLKNCAFIIDHPEDQLPEENGDDDELEIEGGKVDLKCPITLKLFENPYISKKCKHVYDLEGIHNTWTHGRNRGCPTLGCKANLTLDDFEPDKLMRLRVKAYRKQQQAQVDGDNYDRI